MESSTKWKGEIMKNFYVALIEVETEKAGLPFVAAMNELKDAAAPIGKASYFQVASADEYRRVEKEIRRNARS